ncbi:MAG: hypothetical protein IJR85_04785 [Synergistaceae bacterium]|nr:hypothetical protein [Synergistaceae bacterium]
MVIITQARSAIINIVYSGKDISEDLAPYLTAFSFTDNAKDKSDDLSITLQDSRGEWLRDWTPQKSDTITASIIKQDGTSTLSLPCGTFTVDQIDYSLPPHTLSIKAVSSAVNSTIAQTKKSRHWENETLSSILGRIASENNFALRLEGEAGHVFERLDQTEQTDLDFAREVCADYGLAVKVQPGKLWVYSKEDFEAQDSACEIWSTDDRLISARFSSKSAKVYKKAKVVYHHPVKDEEYEGEYEDEDEEGSGRELLIHERVESQGEAESKAKERLIEANRAEITGSLVLVGDVSLAAGIMVTLGGFGMFSGRHFVNRCTHKADGGGFTTTLELGQPKGEKNKGRKSARKSSKSKSRSGNKGVSGEIFYEGEKYYK